MTKELQKSLEVLREQKPYLQETYHVKDIGIFGSFARGEQDQRRQRSDIDILVDFHEDAKIGLIKFIGLENYLSELLDRKVDLVTRDALKPLIKDNILRDTVYV
ncbi:MAG: nucleotidyltransferase family protein [Patescibacteria group bacterium]